MKHNQAAAGRQNLSSLLRQVPLLDGVSAPVLADLERASFRKHVDKGTCLFFRGDPAEDFYLLLSGEIALVLSAPDGRELIINVMKPGDFFGELGLITNQPRSADAIVRRTADLVVIPRKVFLSALEREPLMTSRLLEATATRLRRTSDFQNALAFLDAQARLARVLLELDEQNEERGYITMSQDELAQRAGLIRQTVAKTLGQWRRNGWLLTGRGHIVLLNRNALRLWFKERAG